MSTDAKQEYNFIGGPMDGARRETSGETRVRFTDTTLATEDGTEVRIMEDPEYVLMGARYVYSRLKNQKA